MGTKNDPGEFDCYDNAEPDEPMFVLLARDPLAPILVELWASLRADDGVRTHPSAPAPAKVAEARHCAASMRAWRRQSEVDAAKTTVHFVGGPWDGQSYEVERVVAPVFGAGHPIGNHYWLDTKSGNTPTYHWDGAAVSEEAT